MNPVCVYRNDIGGTGGKLLVFVKSSASQQAELAHRACGRRVRDSKTRLSEMILPCVSCAAVSMLDLSWVEK